MRSPLSSRTNSRPERVTPDEAFDLVASSVVMVFPSKSRLPASRCLGGPLFDPRVSSLRVKPGKSSQIAAKEQAVPRISDHATSTDGWHFSADAVRFLYAMRETA